MLKQQEGENAAAWRACFNMHWVGALVCLADAAMLPPCPPPRLTQRSRRCPPLRSSRPPCSPTAPPAGTWPCCLLGGVGVGGEGRKGGQWSAEVQRGGSGGLLVQCNRVDFPAAISACFNLQLTGRRPPSSACTRAPAPAAPPPPPSCRPPLSRPLLLRCQFRWAALSVRCRLLFPGRWEAVGRGRKKAQPVDRLERWSRCGLPIGVRVCRTAPQTVQEVSQQGTQVQCMSTCTRVCSFARSRAALLFGAVC